MKHHPDKARNQYHACAALKNLAWKSEEMTKRIVDKGGANVVHDVIARHENNEVLLQLANQVYNFLLHSDAPRTPQHGEGPKTLTPLASERRSSEGRAMTPTVSSSGGTTPHSTKATSKKWVMKGN